VNDEEQFFFDLMGYLVIDDVLSADEVAELNALIDEYDFWPDPAACDVQVGNMYQRHSAFRGLMSHPRVMPYLLTLVGPTVRFDHDCVLLTKPGSQSWPVRGGAEPYEDIATYHVQNGRMFNGLVTVSYALTDIEDGDGGFVAVPGSHKSNYVFPADWRDVGQTGPWLRPVPHKAGSAIVFTEALAHGRASWTAAREGRSVVMKYSPGAMSWVRSYPRAEDVPEAAWSDQQRSMLAPPYFQNRSFVTVATEGD
jgi:ectoine hydroxylase-related dioxygenase (phytanoyl-CoA dioxygenase family)